MTESHLQPTKSRLNDDPSHFPLSQIPKLSTIIPNPPDKRRNGMEGKRDGKKRKVLTDGD